ncbi:unnamed protein product [Rhizoctonia solani]|uniref:Uncharacterized protein n=1 Tax=Rhizoctonia solani TaxID=456999 RepID=A0A8H3E1K4_9AGAM|nr:unnamed protein product [Rhizoctonia solani]
MPGWSNLVQIFDRNGKARARVIEGQKAMEVLSEVDNLLDESLKLLTGVRPVLTNEQHESFSDKHTELYLGVVAVRSDVRDREGRDEFFSSPEEKAEFYKEVQTLLTLSRSYHRDVISASQHARRNRDLLKLKNVGAPGAPTQQITLTGSATDATSSTAVSSVVHSTTSTELTFPSDVMSIDSNAAEPYLATVAHIPRSVLASEAELISELPSEDHYYRILICGNKYKRAVVLDPNPQYIKQDDPEDEVERLQDDFLKMGDMLMKSNPQSLENKKLIDSYEGPSFITSIFSQLSLGASNLISGGMV